MKNIIRFILVLTLALSACRKDGPIDQNIPQTSKTETINISIADAKAWYDSRPDTAMPKKYPVLWQNAKAIKNENDGRIIIPLPGQPTYQKVKQGYRQLSFQKDPITKKITASFIEIIPDAVYFQGRGKVEKADFTGRIFVYDENYRLKAGEIYAQGKQVGEIRAATAQEKKAFAEGRTELPLYLNEQASPTPTNGKLARARVIETCFWYQTTYIDADGIFTVYSERMCSYDFYDDGGGGGGYYNDGGSGSTGDYNHGGGGGSTGNDSSAPPPSELPQENQQSVDPKKMMECFSAITTPNAAYQVKVFVLEPLPGTFFNVGPNSFGHVAIQLTKSGDNKLITQTIGFYPTGSGLDKLVSKSRIVDNGGLEYSMSASYWTDAASFQKLINYISSPPAGYHFTDMNCAGFVYKAGQAAGLPIPDPTTQIGLSGPGGAGFAMTPQGMAHALNQQKAANPKADISDAGGRVQASKGECN